MRTELPRQKTPACPGPYPGDPTRSEPKPDSKSEPQSKPYLLFDAGGTLVFPDQPLLLQQAREHGIVLTDGQLFSGYYQLIYSLDQKARQQGHFPHELWPQDCYAQALLATLGVNNGATSGINAAVQAHHSEKNLWTFTFPWVRETLSRLSALGYRMSVLSNSDGRTERVFQDLDLAYHFERIFDSQILGYEKPDPAIFELVLRELNRQASEVLYVGDIYVVDVLGANRAGIGALHLDPLGLYSGWPGVHLPDVRHLPGWLACYTANPSAPGLFPAGDPGRAPVATPEPHNSPAQPGPKTELVAKALEGVCASRELFGSCSKKAEKVGSGAFAKRSNLFKLHSLEFLPPGR